MNKPLGMFFAILFSMSINFSHAVSFVVLNETGGDLHDPERLVQNLPEDQGVSLSYRFSELPLSGEAEKTPWVGGYWPKYLDSVNYR